MVDDHQSDANLERGIYKELAHHASATAAQAKWNDCIAMETISRSTVTKLAILELGQ